MGRTRVIVVGAGTAGCVVAGRLSADPRVEVELIERGPDWSAHAGAAQLSSINWLDALEVTSAFAPDTVATKIDGGSPCLYRRGIGVGGSGIVNAMLALPGLPGDYDEWAGRYGLTHWGWQQVQPWFTALKTNLEVSVDADLTCVDRALLVSASELGLPQDVDTYTPVNGSGRLWRNTREGKRFSAAQEYLDPARGRPNLTITTGATVDRLALDGDLVCGVHLMDGTSRAADHVVLCAGTFETPAILLRSGLDRPGIGQGLQDHPAISVYFALREDLQTVDRGKPAIGTVLRTSSSVGTGDIHLLPVHGTLLEGPPNHGLLMAALMKVTSTGYVALNPDKPQGPPRIVERMLATEADRRAMADAVAVLADVLRSNSFQQIVTDVMVDSSGRGLEVLDDQSAYQEWLQSQVGDYFHAVGTARMGLADDDGAVVDQVGAIYGLRHGYVIDASIMPTVPSANSNLPVQMIAERLAQTWLTCLGDGTGAPAAL